jgi:hypothetical protein
MPEPVARKQQAIQQNLQRDVRAGDCETSSRNVQRVAGSGGVVPAETEEATTPGVRAGNIGAQATLSSFAPTVCKDKQNRRTVIHLDRLVPYLRSATDVRTYGKGSGSGWRMNTAKQSYGKEG